MSEEPIKKHNEMRLIHLSNGMVGYEAPKSYESPEYVEVVFDPKTGEVSSTTRIWKTKDIFNVGKGYYCEYAELGLKECPATKRTECKGCKARHRRFRKESQR